MIDRLKKNRVYSNAFIVEFYGAKNLEWALKYTQFQEYIHKT